MKSFKELGFDSEYEQQLYKDVCAGREHPKDLEELLLDLNNSCKKQYSKSEYLSFIQEFNLGELLDTVKDYTIVDRYFAIWLSVNNEIEIANCIRKWLYQKRSDAEYVYNYEKSKEYSDQIAKTYRISRDARIVSNYILEQAGHLCEEDKIAFFNHVREIIYGETNGLEKPLNGKK